MAEDEISQFVDLGIQGLNAGLSDIKTLSSSINIFQPDNIIFAKIRA